jgi:isopenicillin N synthase-like dioxygenase
MQQVVDYIPKISFGSFRSGTPAEQQQIAEQIYQACCNVGFLYLVDHGLSKSLIARVFEQSKLFFGRPLDVKQRYEWTNARDNRGYIGIGTEQLEVNRPADWKEAFSIRQEANSQGTPNRWVDEQPEFRQTMLEFYEVCSQLAGDVLRAFALSLKLPESFFAEKHGQNYTLRLLHYPPALNMQPEQIRAGAHSDYGSITLLLQDDTGGLEILGADGQWLAAPCFSDAVLVNIGDLMQRWTNHTFRSTLHRVVTPNAAFSSRYSVAFFCHPNPEIEVVCIETENTQTALYPPILAGDYILSKLETAHQPRQTALSVLTD